MVTRMLYKIFELFLYLKALHENLSNKFRFNSNNQLAPPSSQDLSRGSIALGRMLFSPSDFDLYPKIKPEITDLKFLSLLTVNQFLVPKSLGLIKI